eukprot:CAMPEP_0119360202 /NCGR_PEP_ID=MMETSP1334-20130426/7882_1 /TAXON_ID=127549 /ORGANISM="Calcidiscus leptoporus, Strain RCC1130" /LENGTH=131 /DNA_ID=CAMNT_0007375005 /DNA_START=279 /DNA_END=671 /DNA_ORIENTATION=-
MSRSGRTALSIRRLAQKSARLIQPLPSPALVFNSEPSALAMLNARVSCLLRGSALTPMACSADTLCMRIDQRGAFKGNGINRAQQPRAGLVHDHAKQSNWFVAMRGLLGREEPGRDGVEQPSPLFASFCPG